MHVIDSSEILSNLCSRNFLSNLNPQFEENAFECSIFSFCAVNLNQHCSLIKEDSKTISASSFLK